MSVLFVAIPIALFISLIAVIAFLFQVRGGQFDDLDTPPRRILFDDVEAKSAGERGEISGSNSGAISCGADKFRVDEIGPPQQKFANSKSDDS